MKRKQHYVPQFYLKQFADEKGKIYAYDYNEKKLIHVLPKNICAKRFLYETQWKNANENLGKFVFENVIENIFQEYEGEFSALIKKVDKMCTDLQNQNDLFLNSDEIDLLCKLVVNFIIRHPVSLNIFDFQNVIKYIKELEMGRNIYSLFRELDFGSADSIFEAAFKKYMLTEGKENDHFPQILKKEIMQLSFFFIYAKESEFITSDIPVVTIEDDSNNKFIYFVLTPKVAVVFENYIYFKKNRIIEIDANRVDNINKELIEMQTNKKFLICRTEDILKKYINRGEK